MTAQSKSPPGNGDTLISQAKAGFRDRWPVWMQRMPQYNFPPPNDDFQLIDGGQLKQVLAGVDEEIVAGIQADMKHMDYELLRLFRKLDYEAKYHQNRHYQYQIAYMILAFAATLIGSTLALALDAKPGLVPWLAFAETVVALLTTYLATLSGREPPMPLWVSNRRRAEAMRREYFRYLLNLPPYDAVTGYQREMQLSRRAADINRGFFGESEGSS